MKRPPYLRYFSSRVVFSFIYLCISFSCFSTLADTAPCPPTIITFLILVASLRYDAVYLFSLSLFVSKIAASFLHARGVADRASGYDSPRTRITVSRSEEH